MESETNNEMIEGLFIENSRNLSEDKELVNNAILNNFRSEHGKIMNEHATEYTKLLKTYIRNSKKSAKQKKLFKNVFFWVSVIMLTLSFVLFAIISLMLILRGWECMNTASLTGLISSLIGLLSLYIVIPEIIAKYLFNQKEDEDMTKIVESVQSYDEKVFNIMNMYSFGETVEREGGMNAMLELKKEAETEVENTSTEAN